MFKLKESSKEIYKFTLKLSCALLSTFLATLQAFLKPWIWSLFLISGSFNPENISNTSEPRHEKTGVSDQVRHKSACSAIETS